MSDTTRHALLAYVLGGRYCETSDIAERLEELRRDADALAALLLSWRGSTFFHSLLLLQHRDTDAAARLQRELVAQSFSPRKRPPFWERIRASTEGNSTLADEMMSEPLLRGIRHLLQNARLTALPVAIEHDDFLADSTITPASGLVVLVDPNQQLSPAVERSAVEDLALMVNACAPVVVHGNLAAEQRVDRAVEPFDRLSMRDAIGLPLHDGDGSGLATLPQQVLDISLKLTGSSVGNVYLDKRNAPELGLAAASQNVNPLETIAISDEHSVVAWVYRRRRPMVINDIRDFQRMNPTGRYRSVTGPTTAAYAELAVPVFQSSIGQSVRNVIGVINVEKVRRSDGSGDSGYFTYRDLTMLRSVATQLSLWQSHALLTTFSRSLAQLTRRNAVQSHGGGRTDSTPPAPTGIPADATGAREVVEETLRSLYNVTRTYSVAVRLISPDQLRLVRFAAYPAERQDDAHPELMVSDRKSVNAWVARMGRACYIRNRKGTKALAPYPGLDGVAECRDGILSELCLPIFVSGRVVGTLNLESRYKDAYADYVELANALVEQVGLAIAHSRRAQEQEVYSLSIATTANLHQVYRHVARLKDYAAGNLELLGIADAIEDAVAAETLANEPPLTTNALIVSVLHQLHFEQLFEVAPAPVVLLHQGTEALILRIVFEELFRNAHAEWLKAGHHCSVQWALNHMGGQDYLGVRVQNPMLRRLHPAATDLYRAPVRYRSGRQHIGAFLSGALVRSLGGELWAASAAPPRLVARVDLPIHAESVGKEEVA